MPKINGNRVTYTRREVEAFLATWPCATMKPRTTWFEFDRDGTSLVDTNAMSTSGEDAALSEDAQAFLAQPPPVSAREQRLMPGGIPRWFRAYDNRGETADRYTYVLTGKQGEGFSRGCSAHPYHPQGFGISAANGYYSNGKWRGVPLDTDTRHGARSWPPAIGRKHPFLGWRIGWGDLPPDVQRSLLQDYKGAWGL
jgi:hypothetical protein